MENRNEYKELYAPLYFIEYSIFYKRIKDYYFLIDQYLEKRLTQRAFESKFLEMEKEDGQTTNAILTDFEQLAVFWGNSKALEFSYLNKIFFKISPCFFLRCLIR